MSRFYIYVALIAVAAPGCGGTQQSTMSNTLLHAQVSRLRAQVRRDRMTMRDLKNENFVLKDRLDSAKVDRERIGIPTLPVETRTPSAGAATSSVKPRPDYQVVGVDRNGAEIVYMGEATSDVSIRPRITMHGSSEGPRSDRRKLASVPIATDRLPVSKTIPTIANQLRNHASPPASVPGGDPAADYQRYYAALRAGNHAYAVTGFRNFIKRYPDHDYADNAQYWLGEAFYDRKLYEKALVEFRRVVTGYPRGNKVPDALLKIGLTYTSLKQLDKAQQAFKQLMTVYPKGRPAELASAQLAKLKRAN